MTIWYVHEALRDGNKDRARDLCTKIEALSRQVPCLWIRLRTQLQEDEVAEEFFKSIGAQHERRKPFCEEAVAIFPNHEKLQDIEKARSEGLLWFFSKPELFGEALKNQRTYPDVKTELKTAVQITDVGPVTRQSLTRTEGFFDDLLLLTLCDKLIRGQVPE